ncbi:MAG: fatty acid desaturase [Polyangiaceae bacterium]
MDYLRYYLATALMVAGITGFVLGGGWVWLGASTFLFAVLLDLTALAPDYRARSVRHTALVQVPLYLHAPLLVGLYSMAAVRVHADQAGGAPLEPSRLAGVVATLAWLSVVPNVPVVHELLHRRGRVDRFLAFVMSAAIGDPVRRLAHLRGHHALLGLPDDSDTARRGESIYAFAVRATLTATRDSFVSERQRMAKKGLSVWSWRSDVVRSYSMMIGLLAVVGVLAGPVAAAVIAAGCGLSRLLLETFNYLQHYGLVRVAGTPYDRRHTWSHLSPVVRALTFEITNHAHHHMRPLEPFHALVPDPKARRCRARCCAFWRRSCRRCGSG